MNTAKEHYDEQLGAIYGWMAGCSETALQRNRDFFRKFEIGNIPRGLAVDLGAGSGFQSIPLAELGFSVVAVDFCSTLLAELNEISGSLSIERLTTIFSTLPTTLIDRRKLSCVWETHCPI